MKAIAHRLWHVVEPPGGRGVRRFVAGIMIIMGLGRLGLWSTKALATVLTPTEYGLLLLGIGLLLYINGHFRLGVGGRVVAALGAVLMAGMAWDVGYVGVTSLLEAWMALALLKETFTSHDC